MIDSDLEKRLERMYAGYARLPVATDASWHRFIRLRRHAAIQRRALAAGAAVAVMTAAAVAAAFAYHGNNAEPSAGRHVHRPAHIDRLVITARIRQPGDGSGPGDTGMAGKVVAQSGQVWEVTYAGSLFRIDQRTNRVTFREHIPGLWDITAGAGALWVLTKPDGSFGHLLKLDPATGHVITRFPIARRCQQVSYGGTQLWLACGTGTTDFLRINPATGHVIAVAGPARGVGDVAATPTGIWYTGNSGISGFVGTGARLRWVNVVDAAYPVAFFQNTDSLVYGQGALWALTTDESVAKIDPATGRVIRAYGYQTYDPAYSGGLDFMAVGLGSFWFLDYGRPATGVLRVSMATGQPQGRVSGAGSCGQPCSQIYFAGGSVWVPTEHYISRIDPVRQGRITRPITKPATSQS